MKVPYAALAGFALAVALAACEGSIGNGGSSALPFPGASPGSGVNGASPAATPNSATGAASIGSSVAPQALPTVAGYGGTITFAAPSPMPSASGTPTPVSVAMFTTVVTPNGAPDLQEHPKKGFLKRESEQPAVTVHKPLLFVTLNPTTDVTLGSYPAFAFDVPATKIDGKSQFGLAFFDPTEKVHRFKLDVAQRAEVPSPAPSGSPAPKALGTSLARLTTSSHPATSASPSAAPSATPVPTGRIEFAAASAPFTMHAQKTYVFALYTFTPPPSPSPSASASAPAAAASPSPSASASPAPQSPAPSASAAH